MADVMTPNQRSRCMVAIKGKDTKPEILVRKFLFSKGLRYRLNNRKLPGSPDIVLKKYKTVIFLDGCFWHGHEGCKYFRLPKSNTPFWETENGSSFQETSSDRGVGRIFFFSSFSERFFMIRFTLVILSDSSCISFMMVAIRILNFYYSGIFTNS